MSDGPNIFGFKIILLLSTALLINGCTSTYIGRLMVWNFIGYEGYKKYPVRPVSIGVQQHTFQEGPELNLAAVQLNNNELPAHNNLESLITNNQTTSLIVLKNSRVVYEKYFQNSQRDSVRPAFSVSKSVLSMLMGIAIDEGHIQSINEPLVKYLPELKHNDLYPMTLEHLLTMSSGIEHYPSYGFLPWSSDIRVGMSPDIQQLVLAVDSEKPPGREFQYHNYAPVLLAMVLTRATGKTVAQYTEEKLWHPMGMAYPASWLLDSKKHQFEKTDGGFNATTIDYARLGQLVLNHGKWQGEQLISSDWMRESTSPASNIEFLTNMFNRQGMYYKYQWWGMAKGNHYAPIADGRYGQFVYISHEHQAVIVRTGTSMGQLSHKQWYELLNVIAQQTDDK